MSEIKLRPCPFCGNTDVLLFEGVGRGGARIVICDCGASGALSYSKKEAIAAWNRRAGGE